LIYYKKYKLKSFRLLLKCSVFELATSQLNYIIMQTTGNSSKSGVGKSGIKRRNKKEASEWFQSLSAIEQLLLKQEATPSSSSSLEERKTKKEMHERERELILKRQTEHEARMKAQLQSKAGITQQIQKCKDMRRRLIPFQMRLEQMQLHEYHYTFHKYYAESSSQFFYDLGILKAKVLHELRLIQNEEKLLFDMQHKHHCIKKSITQIIEKTKTSSFSRFSKLYTRVQTKNHVDDIYNLVTV
jgi:hypothetical protein